MICYPPLSELHSYIQGLRISSPVRQLSLQLPACLFQRLTKERTRRLAAEEIECGVWIPV